MALDGVLINSIVNELEYSLVGGRIDKIYQPESDEIHIVIRNKGNNFRLLLSSSSNNPRIHLTKHNKQNPLSPPMFCMLLRKHIIGGRIMAFEQPDFERIIIIQIESLNELGDITTKKLIVEIMGRHSNIILLDSSNKILDSIKHVNEEISSIRHVLPGLQYSFPPKQGKISPIVAENDFIDYLLLNSSEKNKFEDVFMKSFTGISKPTAMEIIHRAIEDDCSLKFHEQVFKIRDSFLSFITDIKSKKFTPVVLVDEIGKPKDIFAFYYSMYSHIKQREFTSPSEALEYFFYEKDRHERINQKTSHILKVIKTNLDRCERKYGIQIQEYNEAKNAEKFQLWAELLTANIFQIKQGDSEAVVFDYYDPNGRFITIPLDKRKSPSQNAQAYFKKYRKAKNRLIVLEKQINDNKKEIMYLQSQLDNINKCIEESEIEEIKNELIDEGYMKNTRTSKKNKTFSPSNPYYYKSSDGMDILVGKNNTQNDLLTLKIAHSKDIWLHAKDIPGSHVIIKSNGQQVSKNTLVEAASLAAYYSKGRQSSNVPVDYCPKKNVKKPNGAKPGMVIYDNYNTIYVTPLEDEINKIDKIK